MTYRKVLGPIVGALVFSLAALAQSDTSPLQGDLYGIDRSHSILTFTVNFAGLTKVQGTFNRCRGSIFFDEKDITHSSVTVLIDVKSINTGIADRDQHLQSADFFDAEKHSWIRFQSQRVQKAGDGYLVAGPLTLHGVTREVVIPFAVLSPKSSDPWGNQRVTFEGGTSLNRRDFGVVGPEFWSRAISDEVEIHLVISGRIYNFSRIGFGGGEKKSIGELLWQTVEQEGVDAARKRFHEARQQTPSEYEFRPWDVVVVGYRLQQSGRLKEAISILELATEAFANEPGAADAHTALAEAYARSGDRTRAIEQCEKTLGLNADNTDAMELLRHLRKN